MLDFLLCVVPWPHFWKLDMPVQRRIVLCLLFAGGIRYVSSQVFELRVLLKFFSACVVCIIRIAYLGDTYKLDTSCK